MQMNRRSLLLMVALMAVTLLTAILSTRVFVTLTPYEAPTEEIVTERPTAAMGTTLTPEAAEASRLIQQMVYEQASMAAEAEKAQRELTMHQSQDKIANRFQDKKSLAEYVEKGIADGTLTYEKLFDGTLLIGDYTAATIRMYNLLPERQCIGRTDANLDFLSEQLVSIVANKPETLILHFGMYELQADVLQMQTAFIDRYKSIIQQIQYLLPGIRIVVSSIFPVTNDAQNADPKYANRAVYNAALQAMCADNGWQYLHNETIVTQHADLFGTGGVFLAGDFYEDYWLQYIYVQSRDLPAEPATEEPTTADSLG